MILLQGRNKDTDKQRSLFNKTLVVGVIVLFLGVGIQPSITTVQPRSEKAVQIKEKTIDVKPKDYLLQTITNISNNPDVKDLLFFKSQQNGFNNILKFQNLVSDCNITINQKLTNLYPPVICLFLTFYFWFVFSKIFLYIALNDTGVIGEKLLNLLKNLWVKKLIRIQDLAMKLNCPWPEYHLDNFKNKTIYENYGNNCNCYNSTNNFLDSNNYEVPCFILFLFFKTLEIRIDFMRNFLFSLGLDEKRVGIILFIFYFTRAFRILDLGFQMDCWWIPKT